MKTLKYIALASAVIAGIVACNQKEESVEDVSEITIEAVMAENPASKTIIQEGTTSVLWEAGDEIKVFYDGTGSRFTNQYTEPSGTAKFSGMLNVVFGSNEGFSDETPLWGLYPYRADATADNTSVTTTLPSEQTGRAESFAKGTMITLGKSADLKMGFYNVCGGVRFSLTQEGVKEVVFQGQNDEDIAGKVRIAFVDGVPAVQEVLEGQKTITLTAPNGGTFEIGKWYYIVALPGTLSNGFKMTFNTETQYATLKSSGSKTIKRGIFGSLADADEDLIFKDKGDQPDPNSIIQFEDPIAKYACVEKFDTNGDGEVSYAEAAATTSLSGLFTNWNTVTSFEEIRYFTSVTSTQSVFTGLTKLTHITIPDNITVLGSFEGCSALETVSLPADLALLPPLCFRDCTSLASVTLPTSIVEIPYSGFRNCSSLKSLEIPSSIQFISDDAFYGCVALSSIDLPFGLKKIGMYSFSGCKALASVVIPLSLTSIGSDAFNGCSSLTAIDLPTGISVGERAFSGCSSLLTVVLPEDMTSLPQGCFKGCTKLASIFWPTALTTISDKAFEGCRFEDNEYSLQLPSSVTSIGNLAFGTLRHLIIPSTSPVSIASDSFASGYTILYVPTNMVGPYQVRTNWSNYATRIRPISDYPFDGSIPVGGSVGEAIDLGLSVKWASWNVGASAPEEFGDHFAWGETEPHLWDYDWVSYKWCNGDGEKLTKYCPSNKADYWDGAGSPDGKIVLDLEDDAARANWGGSWRMPTKTEWEELKNNCTKSRTTLNGIEGEIITSKVPGYTDKWIFLPFAGYRLGSYYGGVNSFSEYWSSTLQTDYPNCSYSKYSGYSGWFQSRERSDGYSVRPVTE